MHPPPLPSASGPGPPAPKRPSTGADPPPAGAPQPGPLVQQAAELIGRRWTGVIVQLLLGAGRPLRFREMGQAVPELSDRMLSERLKELEERGLVAREVDAGPPIKVTYALTAMGATLEPVLAELKAWAERWL